MGCASSKKPSIVVSPPLINRSPELPTQKAVEKNIYIITDSNLHLAISKYYEVKQSLGTGQFGTVKLGISKLGSQQKVAIKSVMKERVKEELKNLQRELTILKTLDHPNIIKLYEVFEDEKYLHIVMEYCSGGELYDRLEKKGRLSEKEAAGLLFKMLHAISHMHYLNISHRDLKPENCLFSSKRDDSDLKVVDFGLAVKFNRERGMSSVVGTPYYVAPEIINGRYGPECDLWSIGVIMYTMLAGYPPFRGDNRNDIFKKVLKGKYSLKEKEFETVSVAAKELIKRLLTREPKNRITATQAMEDSWFATVLQLAPDPRDESILLRLKDFSLNSRLKNEIVKAIVLQLNECELKNLTNAFRRLDRDHSGFICANELKTGFVESDLASPTDNVTSKGYAGVMNSTSDGVKLGFTEFLAAGIDFEVVMKGENLWPTFKKFDIVSDMQDCLGFISRESLRKSLEKTGLAISDEEFDAILNDVQMMSKNAIDFKDFCSILDPTKMFEVEQPKTVSSKSK